MRQARVEREREKAKPESIAQDRAPTGIGGLDHLLPRGSAERIASTWSRVTLVRARQRWACSSCWKASQAGRVVHVHLAVGNGRRLRSNAASRMAGTCPAFTYRNSSLPKT